MCAQDAPLATKRFAAAGPFVLVTAPLESGSAGAPWARVGALALKRALARFARRPPALSESRQPVRRQVARPRGSSRQTGGRGPGHAVAGRTPALNATRRGPLGGPALYVPASLLSA